MRGLLLRSAAHFSGPHPDVTAYGIALAHAQYDIARRRFILEYPEEEPPPDISPVGQDWLFDFVALYAESMKQQEELALKLRRFSVFL